MRLLFRLLGIVFFLLPLALVALVFFSVEQQPLVANSASLSHIEIYKAKQIISDNDPRKLRNGQKKSVTVLSNDLTIVLNYLRSQFIKGGVETHVSKQKVDIYGTAILPTNPIGKFLNVKLTLIPDQQKLAIKHFSLGKVELPGFLIQQAFSLYTHSDTGKQITSVANMLQSVQLSDHKLQVSYLWSKEALEQAKSILITQQDKDTLLAYQNKLAVITHRFLRHQRYSLSVIMEPLFAYAAERSVNHDPVVENRALITVLAAYVNGQSLTKLTGVADVKARPLKLSLQKRHDFVQHYTISAGLAVTGGTVLADAIGLFKEYEDSKSSSGFSFTDLAADRAGVRLGKLATDSKASAKRIQKLMSRHLTESVYMPKARDLPEGISAQIFQLKYQGGKGLEYQRVVNLIEKRVDALAIN